MVDVDTLQTTFNSKNIVEIKTLLKQEIQKNPEIFRPNWHPLGFIHCKIAQNIDNDTFRLHVWPSDREATQPQEHKIHDHLFNIDSIVLVGAVENTEYEFVESDKFSDFRIIKVNYSPTGPLLYEDKKFGKLTKTKSEVINSGNSYHIARKTLHETSLKSLDTSITLVRTFSPSTYEPRVALPINSALPPIRPNIPFPLEEWLGLLDKSL
ncbi:hypothetical protein ACCD08_04420 [Telluria sp. Tellsp104]